jgi:hypothetical protein
MTHVVAPNCKTGSNIELVFFKIGEYPQQRSKKTKNEKKFPVSPAILKNEGKETCGGGT